MTIAVDLGRKATKQTKQIKARNKLNYLGLLDSCVCALFFTFIFPLNKCDNPNTICLFSQILSKKVTFLFILGLDARNSDFVAC